MSSNSPVTYTHYRFFRISLLVTFILVNGFLMASSPDLFKKANGLYSSGRYQEAIKIYQQVIENGNESVSLYYNLGNAYFKANDIPSAILFYEKALKLSPTDNDIRFNLNVANTRIVDKIEPVPEFFIRTWINSLVNMLSVDNWARLLIGIFILFFVLVSVYLLSRTKSLRRIAFWAAVFVLIIFLITGLIGVYKYNLIKNNKEAIVFTPTVTIKSSPTQTSVDLFIIHEGTKVKILDKVGDWFEIRIANGSVGWLHKEDVKGI